MGVSMYCMDASHALGGYYCIYGLFGSDFNLAVWRFFVSPPNLNNANFSFIAINMHSSYSFRQIKVTPTMIID